MFILKTWFALATEAETDSAYAPVNSGSHFKVCNVSSTEAEEAKEQKGKIRSFRLRLRR